MPLAVPELIWFALLFFAFAVVYTGRKALGIVFQPIISILGKIPGIGGALAGLVDSVYQSITGVLGDAEQKIDSAIGASFHALAELMNGLWREIKAHITLIGIIAPIVADLVFAVRALKALVHDVGKGSHAVTGEVRTLEREYHGIDKRVRQLEHDVAKGIGSDVLPQIKSLDKELGKLEGQTIPAIRSTAQAAEDEALQALRDVRAIPFPSGVKTWAAAVAVALPVLGLDWLRCDSNPFKGNTGACGLWGILGRVLGLAAFLTVAFDFQEFVDASETVAGFIGTAVADFEGAFPVSLEPLPPPQG